MWSLALSVLIALAIVWITKWVYKWRNPSCNGKLPPGSMGWPLVGETFDFFKPQSSFDIPLFVKDRMKRYGSLFKTSLVGHPVIISTDPEFSHFVFQQDGISIEPWYLDSFMRLLGQTKLTTSSGAIHRHLRNMIVDHFEPQKRKDALLVEMEDMVRRHLDIWSKQESIELKEAATMMSFEIGSNKLLSYEPSKHSESLKDKFTSLFKGLISFPLDIPGFIFHKCLKDQRRAITIIKDILKERLLSTNKHGDFLDAVIHEMKKEDALFNIDSAAYFFFALIFASFETVSLAITLSINFISQHPSVLKDLVAEHDQILRNKSSMDSPLTWKDYTSMTFTSHVIDETLRLSNIAPVLIRRALRDIYVDGYTIPAGWTIMTCPPALHLNPEKYQDTLAFNPWRWKGHESNTTAKDFAAFGGGARLCAGAEFAKLQMSIVLHFLVTKYRWTKISGGEIVKTPGIAFPKGLHIKVTKNN